MLTNGSLFGSNGVAAVLSGIQNAILNTVTGNNTIIAYSWGTANSSGTPGLVLAAGTGTDTFYVGGPSVPAT